MRRGLVVVGVVLLLIGILAAVVPMFLSTSTTIPPANSIRILSPNLIGSGTMTIAWSGADSATTVTVYQCSSSDCLSGSSTVGSAVGGSGSLSFSVSGGTTYAVNETGTSSQVAGTVTVVGITNLALLGIIVIVIGLILVLVGWRTTAQPRAARVARPAERQEGLWSTAPAQGIPQSTSGTEASGGDIMEAAEAPVALSGNRPTLICSHCGTPNEPWITNCRKCKRPLSSTGSG